MDFEEKQLNSQNIYRGKVVDLFVDEVELPDGSHSKREYVKHSGGAAVLFIRDGKIALVRQFRYAYGEETYEIPAGKLNVGEDPKEAALRELTEETGFRAKDSKHLIDIYPTPGYTNEIIHIYLVTDAEFVGEHLDEGEFLNCSYVRFGEFEDMVARGEIKDAKTLIAYYMYKDKKIRD